MTLHRTATSLVALVLCLLVGASVVTGQQSAPAPATATVGGQVTFDENNARLPLRRATVTLQGSSSKTPLHTATDKDGAFRFDRIAPGSYKLSVSKGGFVPVAAPVQFSIAAGAARTESLTAQRAAALEGRVIEDTGRPVAGLVVSAEGMDGGEKETPASPKFTAKTDDLGRFRIHTLPPGRYVVHTTPPAPGSGVQTFFPGTEKREDATVFAAVSGQTVDNVFLTVATSQSSVVIGEAMATQELEALGAPTTGGKWAQVSGRVTRADNGQPVPNATVKLSTNYGLALRTVWTDGAGDFTITRVLAGSYLIAAAADGYTFTGSISRSNLSAERLDVTDGQHARKTMVLVPLGSLEGRVYDEFGDPAPGVVVRVVAMTKPDSPGARSGFSVTGPTDDRGWFRAFGMTGGSYHVCAIPEPFEASGPAVFQPTCFPGTTSLGSATPVQVTAGADAHGVNLTLNGVKPATIKVSVVNTSGLPVPRALLMLAPASEGPQWLSFRAAVDVESTGQLLIQNIPEGRYTIESFGSGEYLSTSVTVDAVPGGEPGAATLIMRPKPAVRGRVVFDGGTPTVPRPGNSVGVVKFTATSGRNFGTGPGIAMGVDVASRFGVDGVFELQGLDAPGVFRVTAPGWALLRVMHQGREITDVPYDPGSGDLDGLEVILTRRVGRITGTVLAGSPNEHAILIFGADGTSLEYFERTMRIVHVAPEGGFAANDLLPGRYFAIAKSSLRLDPESLLQLRAAATLVVVAEGVEAQVRLTVIK